MAINRAREPTQFFDFLSQGTHRLNRRFEHIIWPVEEEIKGARVLDLGSHDGRWPYAIAGAGAREVVGIEGRQNLVDQYTNYPDTEFKGNVRFIVGDYFAEMDRLISQGQQFDMVFCLGVFYHTLHHYRMLNQMSALRPKTIVIDSIFSTSSSPVINVMRNATEKKLNAIAEAEGQSWVATGTMSIGALEIMAGSLGMTVSGIPWRIPPGRRRGVTDYFDKFDSRRRMTVVLRPSTEAS